MPITEQQQFEISLRRRILDRRAEIDAGEGPAAEPASLTASSSPIESFARSRDEGVVIPVDPRDERWGNPPLPAWIKEFRPHQIDAAKQIMTHYAAGKSVVFLQAPTGTGKTIIGEMVGRLIGGKRLYVCNTKTLQDQVAADFPYGSVLKGRSNYKTLARTPDTFGSSAKQWNEPTCAECTSTSNSTSCQWCPQIMACPYRVARTTAFNSELAVLNTSYFLTEVNKSRGIFAGRDLNVIDEGDLLEGTLMGQVEVTVSREWRRKLQLGPPERKTVASSWLSWILSEAIPAIIRYQKANSNRETDSPAAIKERNQLNGLKTDLNKVAMSMQADQSQGEGKAWVYTDYTELPSNHPITFRPVRVDAHGGLLWPHQKKALIMSGTILSADHMAENLGLKEPYGVVDIPMQYPVANRPIYITPVASMAYKAQIVSKPIMANTVAMIADRYEHERVLVHTVSYHLAKYLTNELQRLLPGRTIISYADTHTKDIALSTYLKVPGSILVAASMDRGVDLPDDACRAQIITKVPYANTTDKQVSARMRSKGGQDWYAINTLRTIMQMTGRGVRSDTDYCDTFILDANFDRLWKDVKRFAPDWWADAFDYKSTRRKTALAVEQFLST